MSDCQQCKQDWYSTCMTSRMGILVWDEMRWDEMRWDEMRWDEIEDETETAVCIVGEQSRS